MRAIVKLCYLYPIKSCAPLPVESLSFDPEGQLDGDRKWVVVDSEDRLVWQGGIPELSRLVPVVTPAGIALSAPSLGTFSLPRPGTTATRVVHAWNEAKGAFDDALGFDAGDDAAQFASIVGGQKLRIVLLHKPLHQAKPVHIVTIASYTALAASWSVDPSDRGLLRLRPNIVLEEIDRDPAPFWEERVSAFVCEANGGRFALDISGLCDRCIVTNVDPDTGSVAKEPLKAIAALSRKRHPAKPPYFGVYARPRAEGTLARGQVVRGC